MGNQSEELVGLRLDISPHLCDNRDPRIFILKPISARTVEDVKRHVARTFFNKEPTSHFKFVFSGYRLLESDDALIFNAIKGPIEVLPTEPIDKAKKKKSPQPIIAKAPSFLSSTPFPNGSNDLNVAFADVDSLSVLEATNGQNDSDNCENFDDSLLTVAAKRRRRRYRSKNKALIETIKESGDTTDGSINGNLEVTTNNAGSSPFVKNGQLGKVNSEIVFTTPGTPPSLKNSKVTFNASARGIGGSKGRGPDTPALPKFLNRAELVPVVYDMSVFDETSIISPIKVETKRETSEETYESYKAIKNINEISVGDKIAFKIIDLGENYNPRLSNYREAIVDSIEMETESLKLTYTKKEKVTRSGIFELDYSKDGEEHDMEGVESECTNLDLILFNLLINPKLLPLPSEDLNGVEVSSHHVPSQ